MSIIQPPAGPGQLPPQTDDFTFINASTLHPVNAVNFQAIVGGVPTPVGLPLLPPGGIQTAPVPPGILADRVICDAAVPTPTGTFHWDFGHTPSGWHVIKIICGVQDDGAGGLYPFGLALLRNPLTNEVGSARIPFENDPMFPV
jgi:hypothetical protein